MPTPITRELAQRLELAEAEWNISKLESLATEDNNARQVMFERFGGIRAMAIASHAHNPSYNRAFYLTPMDAQHIPDVNAWFTEQRVSMLLDVVPPLVDGSVLKALHATALLPVRFGDTVFADLGTVAVQSGVPANIQFVTSPPQYLDYAQVLSASFGIPEDLVINTANFARLEHMHTNWKLLVAYVGGSPAALASLYLGEDIASIPVMGTHPFFRRQGLQRQIIEACKTYAKTMGHQYITTQVVSGSGSERNTLRAGFQVAYTKAFWGNRVFDY